MNVFVTGLGIISGLGSGKEENLNKIRSGNHGMGKVTLFSTRREVPVCEVKYSNAELRQLLTIPEREMWPRTALLGLFAVREALADANLRKKLRIGLISSTSVGGMDRSENFYPSFMKDGSTGGRLRDVVHHDCGAITELIAQTMGITDFITTVSTACSSAGNAIMLGARMIKNGLLDAVVAGGTDALCKFTLNGFNSLMILDENHCRPFDKSRTGLNLGEGAGYLVLQGENTLSGNPYCILPGYSNANDAYHQTSSSPEGDGPFLCMKEAVEMAGIRPEMLDYINVHGTGTPNNDRSEGKAMIRLFGSKVPAFSSVKPFVGHALGASEGIEAVLSVLSLTRGIIYPNLNFESPDEDIHLIPQLFIRENVQLQYVLSNSFGFGGNNSSLLFSSLDTL